MKKNTLAIVKNRIKLEKMITENEDYRKILRQSQKLDKLINIEMKAQLIKSNLITNNNKKEITK